MRKPFLIVCAVILALLLVAGFCIAALFLELTPVNSAGVKQLIVIEKGEGAKGVAATLRQKSIIRNATAFEIYVWMEGEGGSLKAGEYLLGPTMSVQDIVARLAHGDTENRETVIIIPEGWTMKQIGAYLVNEKKLFTQDAWDAAAATTDSRTIIPGVTYAFLSDKPLSATLEGYLFPDTYRVFQNATPADVIKKTLGNFGKKVTEEMIAAIISQKKSVFDVITLASIIEKEVRTDADRAMVADVFLKRLRDGIALQSDATVNFITGKKTTRPSNEDVGVDSPYNTYKVKGLPPGPICNPGLSAIQAVLHPESNLYYYFLTKDDGTAVFAKTFEEHKRNIAQYLR